MLALALTSAPLTAQTVPSESANDIVVNMRGVEIADVSEQISRLTGRTLILDPAVKGNVTVTSAEPLSQAGVWDLFQSVLRANGYAAVRSGRAWRIVPAANAVRDGGVPARGIGGQELVTRMIRLANVPSADAARIVRPLVASFGSVEPLTAPNAIVVTDYADNVRRIEALARSLDGGGGSTFTTIVLRNGNAADIAQSLQAVLGDGGARVAGDARSNSIVVRGTPAAVAEARKMAQALDAPGGATPVTRVFRLNYADAESITDVLRGILGDQGTVTNPVARSLTQRRTTGSAGNPTAQLNNLIAQNSNAQSGLTGQSASGLGSSSGISTVGQTQEATPQGFSTPDLTVQPAPDINAIVVRGTPAAIASIERLIPDLDVRRPQVLIEAAIAEIVGDDAEALSVQLGTAGAVLSDVEGAGTSFSTMGTTSLGTILRTLGVPAGSLLGEGVTGNIAFGNDFSILVQALSTSTKSNLLSTPQLTTLDNKVGEFVVAQEVPFVTGSILTNSSEATPYTTIERKDVGITMRVLPRINAGDTIRLEISQEASSISPTQLSTAADIITQKRALNTTVLADDGQTIVLGGLISDDRTQSKSQVPVLGDIPVLGELFKSRREGKTKRTLFIFLKPTILRDGVAARAATEERYARLRGHETDLRRKGSLLINPPGPRLTLEINGIY
ncbi:type II secretion system secretin GspD [Sphingomonas sp.]|uniref:type II secretion system secretin GspD n=1 Tax=Sphingomonas sp. TaxID=28214 RepID=UPI002C4868EB|nr:type II secretion system secretin GspD [Sphingomonas sp.]HWK35529.1 type II secretion system secretin GspD [Sphingomonas sp.]